jgi:hypothetical protein
MRLDVTLARVPIGYAFIGIVTESKICRIYDAVLLIIEVAARNLSGVLNFIV